MPAKSHMDRAERVARRNDRVRLDALKILRHAIEGAAKDPEKVKQDAQLPKNEAPFYLHMATQIGADSIRRETDKREGPGTTLNVMILGQAPTNEAWLQAVKDSQRKVIEAIPVDEAGKK